MRLRTLKYNLRKRIRQWGASNIAAALFALMASLLFLLSAIINPSGGVIKSDLRRLERNVNNRLEILDNYAQQALLHPNNKWLQFPDFPEDMVIYKYRADTIQSWINEFPIGNDEVDVLPLWYRMHYLGTKTPFDTPLAYISENYGYINLGSSWFLAKRVTSGRTKVIAALLIKSDYPAENLLLTNKLNPNFGIKHPITIENGVFYEGFPICDRNGKTLFVVSNPLTPNINVDTIVLRWIAVLLAALALFSFYSGRRTLRVFWLYLAGITLLRLFCFTLKGSITTASPFFSASLYADFGIFSTFGDFLLNGLYLFVLTAGIYLLRKNCLLYLKRCSQWRRWELIILLSLYTLALIVYIHWSLRSIILNSTITLELFRLDEMSIYTILVYLSTALLMLGVLLMLQFVLPILNIGRNGSMFKPKSLLLFSVIISLYTIATISILSFYKEKERAKVWTNKLAIERDLSLELKLLSIERQLSSDPVIAAAMEIPERSADIIKGRLDDLYLKEVRQKYEINITLCRPNDALLDSKGQRLIDCNSLFENSIINYGVPLAEGSSFFFLNNFNGRVSYLGLFNYQTSKGQVNFYIQLDSRNIKDVMGYPALLDFKQNENLNIPSIYSYAKYVENRLILYRGRYNYSTTLNDKEIDEGFSTYREDNYLHFANRMPLGDIIIVSRPQRSIFPYIVSFSYMMLFYLLIAIIFLRLRRAKKNLSRLRIPKNSFRRRVTMLITTSLVLALAFMGVGSVWFCINYYRSSNRAQMEEKLQSVQTTLSDFCKYANQYNDINTPDLFQAMNRISNNAQVDINLYDPHGRLIRSTRNELFDRFILSSRMSSESYYQIITQNRRQYVKEESIGKINYKSLYAPILNNQGKLIAIANIPYFARSSDLSIDISYVVATIINIYILLILAAALLGTILANSFSKPLAELSNKLKLIDLSKHAEHINYKSNDELGSLVIAYNKMVDDLEESTSKLAQQEREHAWSEMARQIAHEIKNPLTPMRLSIQHLIRLKRQNVPGWEEKLEAVGNSILEQIEILSDTASEFSSFAKFYVEDNQVVDLGALLQEQKTLFDTRENIKILYDRPEGKCLSLVRRGQIVRVIVNYLSNAIQALEEIGKGYIRISIYKEGSYWKVKVEDSGNGVKEENRGRLFSPNFTTKSSGTGLGLAISRNVVEQSGGEVGYNTSQLLGGACFWFTLPIY